MAKSSAERKAAQRARQSEADTERTAEVHQQREREEHPMCRNCNDGIRNGCSSCAYKDK